jgi:hypothetical protein
MSNHPHKKPRLIIIKKEQDKSTPNRAKLAPLGGAPPLACTRFNNKTWQEYQDWLNANQQTYEHIYKRPLKCIYGAPREISHKKIPPQAKILVIEMNNDENKIMGIGEIINQTASEVYRRPQAVVPLPTASGSVLNQDKKPAVNKAELAPSLGAPPTLPPPTLLPPTNRAELAPSLESPPTRKISYKIFSDRNYERYIYIGNTRYATREELERNHTPDAQYINEQLANANTKMPQTSQQLQHPPTPLSMIETTERLLFKGPRHMKRGSGITQCFVVPQR